LEKVLLILDFEIASLFEKVRHLWEYLIRFSEGEFKNNWFIELNNFFHSLNKI
jgi:hypothetical protein